MDTTSLLNQLSQLVRLTDNLAGLSSDKLREIYSAVEELMHASEGYLARAQSAEGHLGNLLARIHRDGGYYQNEHGTDKAVSEASIKVAEMYGALDGYEKALSGYDETGEQ